MKNLLSLFAILLILSSCTSDLHEETLINLDTPVEVRNPHDWCDGGYSNPPGLQLLGGQTDPATGDCCVYLLIDSQYAGMRGLIRTTPWDFNTQTGQATGINYPFIVEGAAIQVECFEQLGTHFMVEIYDANFVVACNVFENPCM